MKKKLQKTLIIPTENPKSLPKNFDSQYDLKDSRYNIVQSFESIGWKDPFDSNLATLAKNKKAPTHMHMAYIPSKELMFSMMRACINIEKPQDLWIN